jgi:hypothetical protein
MTAFLAHQQTLEQITAAASSLAAALAILGELLVDCGEDGFLHDCGDRDGDLVFDRRVVDRRVLSRLRRLAALAPQAGTLRTDACLPKPSLSRVGGILEDPPHRRAVPVSLASRAEEFTLLKLATDLANRTTVQRHPRENLPHNLSLSLDDLVARLAASFVRPDVTVAVRRSAEDVHGPCLRRVPFPPAASFKNLGAFIFRHHPLNLEQQILLGRPADVVVEEDNLDAVPLKLLDKEHLVRVVAGESIGRVNIQPVEGAGRSLVAEPLQGRAEERAAAVAFVDEAQFGFQPQAVGLDARLEGLDLAGDRIGFGMLLRRDARVDRRPQAFRCLE